MTESDFAAQGEHHFERFAARFPLAQRDRLTVNAPLLPADFARLRLAVLGYLSECLELGVPALDEQALLDRLLSARDAVPNLARGGQLVPKRDHILEFNMVHRCVADVMRRLQLEDLVEVVGTPLTVRATFSDEASTDAPRTPVWSGLPPDALVAVLPVLGDVEAVTTMLSELAPGEQLRWMRPLHDLSDGAAAPRSSDERNAGMKPGHLHVADARLLRRTAGSGARGVLVSIELRFRLKGTDAYRKLVAEPVQPFVLHGALPYERWLALGRDGVMVFAETQAEARSNGRTRLAGPASATEHQLQEWGRSTQKARPAGRARVLIVEDNVVMLDMLRAVMTYAGNDVTVAVDGKAALELATDDPPDAILLDLSLPVMDGWTLARRLKADERTRNVPIIALTASTDVGKRADALAAGCDEFNLKPLNYKVLANQVNRLIAQRQERSSP